MQTNFGESTWHDTATDTPLYTDFYEVVNSLYGVLFYHAILKKWFDTKNGSCEVDPPIQWRRMDTNKQTNS